VLIKIISFAKKNILRVSSIILFLLLFLVSCSNDLETINSIIAGDTIPVLYVKNFTLTRTEEGRITYVAEAPVVKHYVKEKDTVTLFPLGIKVKSFSEYPTVESMIIAGYAKHFGSQGLWEVKNNVIARNYKGDTLFTEQLFWDEKKKLVYGNKFCKIITSDGVIIGKNGFEADESLTKWKVINTEGTVNVKDE